MSSKAILSAKDKCAPKSNSNSKNDDKRKTSLCRPNNRALEESAMLQLISTSLRRSDADALELRSKASVLDQIAVVQRDISDLRITILGMETKMSLICRGLPLTSEAIAQSNSSSVIEDFHKLEIRLSKAESLITRLGEEVAEQNQELAMRDERDRRISEHRATKVITPDDQGNSAQFAKVDSKLRKLDRKLTEFVKEKERRQPSRSDLLNLESKLLSLRELMLDRTEMHLESSSRHAWDSNKSADLLRKSQDPEVHANLNVEQQKSDAEERAKMTRKFSKLSDNVGRACRLLSGGLNDVQKVAVELISWSDEVHEAFRIIEERLELPFKICPKLQSSYQANALYGES